MLLLSIYGQARYKIDKGRLLKASIDWIPGVSEKGNPLRDTDAIGRVCVCISGIQRTQNSDVFTHSVGRIRDDVFSRFPKLTRTCHSLERNNRDAAHEPALLFAAKITVIIYVFTPRKKRRSIIKLDCVQI